MENLKSCQGPGCTRPTVAKGYCNSHYEQSRRLGYVRPIRERGKTLVRDPLGNKQCSQCGDWKPESVFGPYAKSRDGLRSECADCRHQYYLAVKESRKDRNLQRRFGITLDERDQILAKQDGRCAICKTTESGSRDWVVDHDHSCCSGFETCGKCVRGVLCTGCNLAIGNAHDDIALLKQMIIYLERSGKTKHLGTGH